MNQKKFGYTCLFTVWIHQWSTCAQQNLQTSRNEAEKFPLGLVRHERFAARPGFTPGQDQVDPGVSLKTGYRWFPARIKKDLIVRLHRIRIKRSTVPGQIKRSTILGQIKNYYTIRLHRIKNKATRGAGIMNDSMQEISMRSADDQILSLQSKITSTSVKYDPTLPGLIQFDFQNEQQKK